MKHTVIFSQQIFKITCSKMRQNFAKCAYKQIFQKHCANYFHQKNIYNRKNMHQNYFRNES